MLVWTVLKAGVQPPTAGGRHQRLALNRQLPTVWLESSSSSTECYQLPSVERDLVSSNGKWRLIRTNLTLLVRHCQWATAPCDVFGEAYWNSPPAPPCSTHGHAPATPATPAMGLQVDCELHEAHRPFRTMARGSILPIREHRYCPTEFNRAQARSPFPVCSRPLCRCEQ